VSAGGDPTKRFSGRVDDYVRTRPSYPAGLLGTLRDACALGPSSAVADLGSGTGIFTRLLLESGATVHAVEPNEEMRAAAEKLLRGAPRFHSVAGRAERTTLADGSVDLVTAAQAFHWFDVEQARAEIVRIVRPVASDSMSNVALVWNDRDLDSTPFARAYEDLLVRRCPRYVELQGKADATAKFDALLGRGRWSRHTLSNEQQLDREGLVGRLMSSSYAPHAGDADHDETFAELRAVFAQHAQNGVVTMRYTTVVITGRAA
jgi:SAM-dependent methyltransferase